MSGEIAGNRRHESAKERKRDREEIKSIVYTGQPIFRIEKSGKTSQACKLTVRLHAALR